MFIEDSKSYLDWINIFQNDKPLTHLPQDISYNMIAFANMYNVCIYIYKYHKVYRNIL